MIAESTAQILGRISFLGNGTFSGLGDYSGIYHLTSAGTTNWYEFSLSIRKFLVEDAVRCGTIEPIPTSEFKTPAPRPKYSILDNGKLQSVFQITMPPWNKALELCVAQGKQEGRGVRNS